jgi:hypothetical protein
MGMMYSASRTDLKTIVQRLRASDDSQWEEQIRLLSDTMAVLTDMSRPITRRDKTGSRSIEPDLLPPGAAKINAAMPYLRGMLAAMFGHNRKEALEYGETALEFLPDK